jgi:Mg-chelatase subunit ChlD
LLVAKEADTLSPGQVQQKAQSIFQAMYSIKGVENPQITSTYDPNTGQLSLAGTVGLKTTLAGVLGVNHMNIAANTEVVVGGADLEIVLVLDNTGSMGSKGKMEKLVAASTMFISELKKASKKSGDIKVGIVPFDTRVSAGSSYKAESWIDWGSMSKKEIKDWEGCLIDRAQPYDVQDTAPSSATTLFPAGDQSCALASILPLTSDFNLATSRIGEMKPAGKTNLTIGLAWGWHMLSSGVPLIEGAPSSPKVKKFIVFLTDGLNTQNRWTGSASDIDARTKQVCDNIRAAKILVYTIRVMEGNEDLLRSCATTSSMYYNVPAVSEMMAVFSSVLRDISMLRIAK